MNRTVRFQLAAFAVLTVIGLSVMAVVYLDMPRKLGVNRTDVTLEMPDTGGLYPHANVSYLGETIGRVDSVTLHPDAVRADVHFAANAGVPENVTAAIRSVSAVGEQFVELIPDGPPNGEIDSGTVIGMDRVEMPQGVGPVLDQADALLTSIDDAKMRNVIDEAFDAFSGSDRELQELLDSTRLFLQEAEQNSEVTSQLIRDAEPFLDSQVRSSDSIRSWTRDLAEFADQLRANEPEISSLLEHGPETLDRVTATMHELRPTMPVLVANLVSLGEVGVIYNRSIEQILVIYPALASALMTAVDGALETDQIKVDFNLQINNPPPCTTGFIPAADRRGPAELSTPAIINDLYCKVPSDSATSVRGARNLPCMEYPDRRGASPQQCREGGYGPQHVQGHNPPDATDIGPPATTINPPSPPGPEAAGPNAEGVSYSGDRSEGGGMTTSAAVYDPATGEYVASDGRVYQQTNLGDGGRLPSGAGLTEAMTNGVA